MSTPSNPTGNNPSNIPVVGLTSTAAGGTATSTSTTATPAQKNAPAVNNAKAWTNASTDDMADAALPAMAIVLVLSAVVLGFSVFCLFGPAWACPMSILATVVVAALVVAALGGGKAALQSSSQPSTAVTTNPAAVSIDRANDQIFTRVPKGLKTYKLPPDQWMVQRNANASSMDDDAGWFVNWWRAPFFPNVVLAVPWIGGLREFVGTIDGSRQEVNGGVANIDYFQKNATVPYTLYWWVKRSADPSYTSNESGFNVDVKLQGDISVETARHLITQVDAANVDLVVGKVNAALSAGLASTVNARQGAGQVTSLVTTDYPEWSQRASADLNERLSASGLQAMIIIDDVDDSDKAAADVRAMTAAGVDPNIAALTTASGGAHPAAWLAVAGQQLGQGLKQGLNLDALLGGRGNAGSTNNNPGSTGGGNAGGSNNP